MAFRIAAANVPDTMQALWRREMPSGAYFPRWLPCRTQQGAIQALAFVMNRNTDAYVRDLSRDQLIRIVQNAHGKYGPCVEYVLETAQELKLTCIREKKIEAIVHELRQAPARKESTHYLHQTFL